MSPAGRPPLSDDERKADQIRIRVSSADKATLDAAAEAAGQATGPWLRDMGLAAAAEQAAAKPAKKTPKKKA